MNKSEIFDKLYNIEELWSNAAEFLNIPVNLVKIKMKRFGNVSDAFNLYFKDKELNEENILNFYTEQKESIWDCWGEIYHKDKHLAIANYINTIPNIKNILDYSGGIGQLAATAKLFNMNITYSDIGWSKKFAEWRHKKYELDIPSVDSNELKDNYDIIICTEVFEHLFNIDKTLKYITDHINSGGYLIFTESCHDTGRPEHLLKNNVYFGKFKDVLAEYNLFPEASLWYDMCLVSKENKQEILKLSDTFINVMRKK